MAEQDMEDLASLLREVKGAFCSIDRFVVTSDYIQGEYPESKGTTVFLSSKNEDPIQYLQDEGIVQT
jgi:hypothetical protein